MSNEELTTQQNILKAAEKEFLAKGFTAASLRNIVKTAGVTTGAFYGYYSSKEALFHELVKEPASVFMNVFRSVQDDFANLPPQEQLTQMGIASGECMDWMVEYIYEHFTAFKLILCCSQGTEYEHFIHTMVDIEVNATHAFTSVLHSLGYTPKHIDSQLEHILVSGQFSAFFEMVIHDMPKSQAILFVKDMRAFYTAGWQYILQL